jgi:hypothetical protein
MDGGRNPKGGRAQITFKDVSVREFADSATGSSSKNWQSPNTTPLAPVAVRMRFEAKQRKDHSRFRGAEAHKFHREI